MIFATALQEAVNSTTSATESIRVNTTGVGIPIYMPGAYPEINSINMRVDSIRIYNQLMATHNQLIDISLNLLKNHQIQQHMQ